MHLQFTVLLDVWWIDVDVFRQYLFRIFRIDSLFKQILKRKSQLRTLTAPLVSDFFFLKFRITILTKRKTERSLWLVWQKKELIHDKTISFYLHSDFQNLFSVYFESGTSEFFSLFLSLGVKEIVFIWCIRQQKKNIFSSSERKIIT